MFSHSTIFDELASSYLIGRSPRLLFSFREKQHCTVIIKFKTPSVDLAIRNESVEYLVAGRVLIRIYGLLSYQPDTFVLSIIFGQPLPEFVCIGDFDLLKFVRRRMIWNRRRDFGVEGLGSVG